MTEPDTTARDTLRSDILAMGRDGFVSMADVQGQVSRGQLADSVADCQRLIVDTVRSLLEDGFVELGVAPNPSDPEFKKWPGSVDEVMTRFIERFVTHHENRMGWEYAIWFNLTPTGGQAAIDC